MKIDVSRELRFQTARSGGKGGQNVNKVETMVEAYFHVNNSAFFSVEEKETIHQKLSGKINASGELMVKSQVHRSQLSNKTEATRKLNNLLEEALKTPKKRKASQPSKSAIEKRLETKKLMARLKMARKPVRMSDL